MALTTTSPAPSAAEPAASASHNGTAGCGCADASCGVPAAQLSWHKILLIGAAGSMFCLFIVKAFGG